MHYCKPFYITEGESYKDKNRVGRELFYGRNVEEKEGSESKILPLGANQWREREGVDVSYLYITGTESSKEKRVEIKLFVTGGESCEKKEEICMRVLSGSES